MHKKLVYNLERYLSSINFRVLFCDFTPLPQCWASLVAQLVKNPPAIQETLVQFLGWEDALEKGKATHSSVLENWRPI